eukprot:TRINITY_DN16788_c0_g1_i1.p2 TRINITY_DN16788_c0_g1~~TRINITY_DN16788_c0_g1_i1.p2  ORF type:complete len:272 (+),score=60.65 TRINITY_DN16788_c0_g1_i1:73-816(+)
MGAACCRAELSPAEELQSAEFLRDDWSALRSVYCQAMRGAQTNTTIPQNLRADVWMLSRLVCADRRVRASMRRCTDQLCEREPLLCGRGPAEFSSLLHSALVHEALAAGWFESEAPPESSIGSWDVSPRRPPVAAAPPPLWRSAQRSSSTASPDSIPSALRPSAADADPAWAYRSPSNGRASSQLFGSPTPPSTPIAPPPVAARNAHPPPAVARPDGADGSSAVVGDPPPYPGGPETPVDARRSTRV